jgi:amino acid transporter/nucleotide-binding universal stress UspA family protein
MAETPKTSRVKTELGRELGLTSALSIGVGTMIAAGIFTLSGLAIRNVGTSAIISFGIAALVSLLTALTYCEFVSIYPRSGEGYLYARKTFSAPIAYIVGFSLFLGYASSCAFYIASLSSYFFEFILETPLESASGIIVLIGLTMLNVKGTKESGKFQIIVTAAKIVLLIWFIIGGLQHIDTDELISKFSTDIGAIAQTSALVFITFFGFSAIAASAGEVKRARKNIPIAIFLSVGIVTVLYVFVVVVTIAANLSEYTEAAMGVAAKKFLGGIGGMVIVGGAIFSMISASNASIMAGSRVALSMSQLGHLPKEIGIINERTRTPIMALFAVCGLILVFILVLPLESLAHFADTVLLFALTMVNAALIVHRRKYPNIRRIFKVPFVPLLPILGIIANLYLLSLLFVHLGTVILAIFCLILGFVGFISWKGAQHEEEAIPGAKSKVALGRFAAEVDPKIPHILIPISNPSNVKTMMTLAEMIAKDKSAVVVVMKVIVVPQQMPLDYNFSDLEEEKKLLDYAQNLGEKKGLNVTSILRIGYDPAKAILETAREYHCKLVMLGWKGFSSSADKILGKVTDAVVTHARRDIMLIKLSKSQKIKNILLPSGGGEHAKAAETYAATMVKAINGSLTICRVEREVFKGSEIIEEKQKELNESLQRIRNHNGLEAKSLFVFNDSITEGIHNASADYDTIMVGATRDSIYQQILFGSIPEAIAKASNKTVIMVKHYHPVKALIGRVVSEE